MTATPHRQAPPDITVNGYRLLTRIGEGGMGVVHLAQRPGEPRVALKVLRPNIVGDDEARARLAREVSSLERIRGPRVAEIVDADPWGDIPYVATRYVPGLSVHDHVREEGPITGPDLVWLAAGLAEAIAAVHACGVLHRDVKPSNVLLEGRNPVLIDFGLARVADDPKLTHTGWLLGTPGYLAPEILLGQDATIASDVHSWAATVAFAGLGRAPFGGGPGMAIMDRVRRGEHDLGDLPPAFRALLGRCLDPSPARRPGLPEILAELRPASGSASDPVGARRDGEDPFTMPLRLAAVAGIDPPTTGPTDVALPEGAVDAGALADGALAEGATAAVPDDPPKPAIEWPHGRPGETLVERPGATVVERPAPAVPAPAARAFDRPTDRQLDRQPDRTGARPADRQPARWDDDNWSAPQEFGPAIVSPGERMRRGVLTVILGLVAVAGIVAFPPVAAAVLIVGVWLARSGSVATSAHHDRRRLRGSKWYDGPQILLSTPWYLIASLPGTLLLLAWAGAMGLAGGLLGYAFLGTTPRVLLALGVLTVIGLWTGPGSTRLRGPVSRLVNPVCRRPAVWFVVSLLVGALAALLGGQMTSSGVEWWPFTQLASYDVNVPSLGQWWPFS